MDDPVFLGVVLLGTLMGLVYYVSKVKARTALLARLEDRLKHTAKEKVFLAAPFRKQGGG